MRMFPRRPSRYSSVLALVILTAISGIAITATTAGAAGVRFGFVDSVTSWLGGGATVNVVAEPQPTPDGEEAPAAVNSITSLGTPFTENFNGIGSGAPATLPAAWVLDSDTTYTGGATATTLSAGTSGAGTLTGTSSGGYYNFADGVNASSTDRAVGFLTTGSFTSPRNLFVRITNNTGATINSLAVSYNIEKYRAGTRAWTINFFSGTDGSTWTAQTAGDQSYAADGANAVVDPPTSVTKSVLITGLSVADGGDYYFRWAHTGTAGSTNGQGLGIDNFSVTAGPSTRLVATTGTDTGDCVSAACATITYAIGQAAAGDTISIAAGTYTQLGITVDKNLTITGAGAATTIVQANAAPNMATNSVFIVNSGVTASISGLTIRHGNPTGFGGGIFAFDSATALVVDSCIIRANTAQSGDGGGIWSGALSTTISNSTISGNTAGPAGGNGGGGLFCRNTSNICTVNNSAITDNTTVNSGGGINLNGSTLILNNSTVSGNSATINGGGLQINGPTQINYSTVTNNSASGLGGGIRIPTSSVASKSSIVAGNQAGGSTTAATSDCSVGATLTSGGYNLTGSSTGCTLAGTGDTTVAPANVFTTVLAALGSNGGATQTHALLAGSPALDQIPNGTNDCGTAPFNLDQRGTVRPSNVSCDKGAFELLLAAPTIQASNIFNTAITSTSMSAFWTNGNGSKRIVKMNTSNSFTDPVDGTDPTGASTVWANAGEQLIYNGISNGINVTGLTPGGTYWFRVYEANGTGSTIVFNTATATNNPNSGTTSIPAPNTQASNITFASVTANSMTVNWTNGNGSKRVVKMNTSNSFTNPVLGTDPAANPAYGGSGQQVVYNDTGNSVAITGLSPATTYHFRVYEANGSGSTVIFNLNPATNNPNSQATTAPPPTLGTYPPTTAAITEPPATRPISLR